MTLPVNVARVRLTYPGDTAPINLTGGDGALYYLSPAHLIATLVTGAGAVMPLAYGADFTATDGSAGAGSLTMVNAKPAGVITVRRVTPDIQQSHWADGDGNPAARFESTSDYGRMIDQERQDFEGRALAAPDYDAPLAMTLLTSAARAGYLLKWDVATGAPVNSSFSEAQLAAAISLLLNNVSALGVTKVILLSQMIAQGQTLAFADAAAAALGGTLRVDHDVALAADTTLNSAVMIDGGILTHGAHALTFTNAFWAPDVRVFDAAGAGVITMPAKMPAVKGVWFGVVDDPATASDAAVDLAFGAVPQFTGGYVDFGTFKVGITRAHVLPTAVGFKFSDQAESRGGFFVTGTGYTAITATGQCVLVGTLKGPGGGFSGNVTQALNGILLSNVLASDNVRLRAQGFFGLGVKLSKVWDCSIADISVEDCGSDAEYAFSMVDGGDTTNLTVVQHLQVETAYHKAIQVSANTLHCTVNQVHSEQAIGVAGTRTWDIEGNRCVFNNWRMQGDANCTARVGGGNSAFHKIVGEGTVPFDLASGTQDPNDFFGCSFSSFGYAAGNFGPVTFHGGVMTTLKAAGIGPVRAFGMSIGTVWTQTAAPAAGTTKQSQLYGCLIGATHVDGGYPEYNYN